ncbi:hypothetical protein ABGB18_17495 [Nonomuraea sp. B12E4]|uniref:hypothetical protein n=1 Tax=Nonomuraea sp. B12E4 TaxID=3153564 RepID=UPI00325DC21E
MPYQRAQHHQPNADLEDPGVVQEVHVIGEPGEDREPAGSMRIHTPKTSIVSAPTTTATWTKILADLL